MKLKVLSWNIWIDGYFDQVTDFLRTSNADIVGLQEVVSDDPKRGIIDFLEKSGYQHVFDPVEHSWRGKIYRDGPAIFSKYKILKSETYVLSETDKRAAVRADILISNKTLHVFSTHLLHTHQKESEEQNEQTSTLLKILPSNNTVIMGDFNATPESSAIKGIKKVFADSDPSSKPTWSVYPEGCITCNPQEVNTRLDYIFTSKDIKADSFKVEESKASDHLPISVILDV